MDGFDTSPNSSSGDKWTVKIRKDVQESIRNPPTASSAGPKPVVMCRVRRQHRELKPDHYAATEFSFGLFDRSLPDAQQTRADKCRILMAGAVLQTMGMTKDDSWEKLCKMVVPDAAKVQDRYHELERDPLSPSDVSSLLTLDAVYIASYLGSKYNAPFAKRFPKLQSAIDPTTSAEKLHPLLLDLFKVENQIPLSLIRRVLEIMLQKAPVVDTNDVDKLADAAFAPDVDTNDVDKLADATFRSICEGAIDTFCSQLPGYIDSENYSNSVDYLTCDTFVDCMYRGMAFSIKKKKAINDSSASVPLRNMEAKDQMESQSSASDQDYKLDIQHLSSDSSVASSVTSQGGKLKRQPQMPTDEGTASLEANGRTQERIKPVRALQLQISSSSKVAPSSLNKASELECQPQKWSEESAGTSLSQASTPERQPLQRTDDETVASQDGKLKHRPLKRIEDGNLMSQFSKLESQPSTPREGDTATDKDRKSVQREPLKQGEKRTVTSQAGELERQALNPKSQRGKQVMILPSVTELRKAGIEFKGVKGYSIHDIELEKGLVTATLHLPTVTMNDDTELIWRNLVAYEHAHSNENPDFIQFLDFMDRLIDSPDDVMYLRRKKCPVILDNLLGTNEAVAKIFNNTVLQYSCYEPTEKWTRLHRDIFDFYKQPARHLYLDFRKTYFSKPWLTISVAAATILLFLTFVQTYYTAKAYHHRV